MTKRIIIIFSLLIFSLENILFSFLINSFIPQKSLAASPYFEMFVDQDLYEILNNSVNPAIYFHAKNGFSDNIKVEFTDINMPTDTQFVISSVNDHINMNDVPDIITPANVSEIKKLNIPLGSNEWNFLSPTVYFASEATREYSFKVVATGGGYTQEKIIRIKNYKQDTNTPTTMPIPSSQDAEWNKHTVTAGNPTTYKLAVITNYNANINLSYLIPDVPGLSASLNKTSMDVVNDSTGENNRVDFTVSTTSATPNGYYMVGVKSSQPTNAPPSVNTSYSPDVLISYRLKVNNSQNFNQADVETPTPTPTTQQNQTTPSQNQPTTTSQPSTSQTSSAAASSDAGSATVSSTSKQIRKEAQREENSLANTLKEGEDAGALSDTQGELSISPDSGPIDSKIELKGKNYPKDTELRILWGPFQRYVRNKSDTNDNPPFRWQGLLDLGIIKTDNKGEFSIYRILPTDDPIVKTLIGKQSIRVGEDKVFSGKLGMPDSPINQKLFANFTIPIPVGQSQTVEQQATSQIWTGKENLNELSKSEKVAVNNLSLGLKEDIYNQPFMEEKTTANQVVTSYSIEGNLGADGKRCKLQINSDQQTNNLSQADFKNPFKFLSGKIFNIPWSFAQENAQNDLTSQVLEDCPKTVKLSDFWKSPITTGYQFGKYNNEKENQEISQAMSTLFNIYTKLRYLLDSKTSEPLEKTLADILALFQDVENIPYDLTFYSLKGEEITITNYRDFLRDYTSVVIKAAKDLEIDESISKVNETMEKTTFFKSLGLTKIEKEKIRSYLASKQIEQALVDLGEKELFQNKCPISYSNNNLKDVYQFCSNYGVAQTIKKATTRKEMDSILEQLKNINFSEGGDAYQGTKMKLVLVLYGLTRHKSLPEDRPDQVKQQLEEINKYREMVINSEDLLVLSQLNNSVKLIGKNISDPKALAGYQDLATYLDIKYRYLLHFEQSANEKGLNISQANFERSEKIGNLSIYPYLIDDRDLTNPVTYTAPPNNIPIKSNNKILPKVFAQNSPSNWDAQAAIKEINQEIQTAITNPTSSNIYYAESAFNHWNKVNVSLNNPTFSKYAGSAINVLRNLKPGELKREERDKLNNAIQYYNSSNKNSQIQLPLSSQTLRSGESEEKTNETSSPTSSSKPTQPQSTISSEPYNIPNGVMVKVLDLSTGKVIYKSIFTLEAKYFQSEGKYKIVFYKIDVMNNKETKIVEFKSKKTLTRDEIQKTYQKASGIGKLDCEEWLGENSDIYETVVSETDVDWGALSLYWPENLEKSYAGQSGTIKALAAVTTNEAKYQTQKCISSTSGKFKSGLINIYSGSIPSSMVGTFDDINNLMKEFGFGGDVFFNYAPQWFKDAANAGIKEGKCGWQAYENPERPGEVWRAVILCDSLPKPGLGPKYTPIADNSLNTTSKNSINTALAVEDTTNSQTYYTNFIHLFSEKPIGLMVIDPTGRAVGWNPLSQKEVAQLTNTSYNGISAANPEMLIRGLTEGEYSIRLIGLEDGPYKVNLAMAMGDEVWTKTYQGMVKKNEIIDGSFKVGLEKQTTQSVINKLSGNKTAQFTALGLGILLVLGAAYYYIHTQNRLKLEL